MDKYRWVVDKVTAACELPEPDGSVIHPSLVKASNGDLLLFGSSYKGPRFDAKRFEPVVVRSRDHGTTWSEPEVAFPQPLSAGIPRDKIWGGATLKSGRMLQMCRFCATESKKSKTSTHPTGQISPYGFAVQERSGHTLPEGEWRAIISDDDGRTWSVGEPFDRRPGGLFFGHPVGGFTVLEDDTVLQPVTLYKDEKAVDGWQMSNGYLRSADGGRTWNEPTIVAPYDERLHDLPSEMAIVVLPDGRWVALYRNQFTRDDTGVGGNGGLWRSYSLDQGATWTVGHYIFPTMGYTTARLLPDGALIVMGHGPLFYAVSNSGGETWDYQNRLWGLDYRFGGDGGGFGVQNLDDGRVLIAYYGKTDRAKLHDSPFEYGKMRLEVAWLKKVEAESVEGRMR